MILEWYRTRREKRRREEQIELIRGYCHNCACNIGCTVTPEELIEGKTCTKRVLCEIMGLRP